MILKDSIYYFEINNNNVNIFFGFNKENKLCVYSLYDNNLYEISLTLDQYKYILKILLDFTNYTFEEKKIDYWNELYINPEMVFVNENKIKEASKLVGKWKGKKINKNNVIVRGNFFSIPDYSVDQYKDIYIYENHFILNKNTKDKKDKTEKGFGIGYDINKRIPLIILKFLSVKKLITIIIPCIFGILKNMTDNLIMIGKYIPPSIPLISELELKEILDDKEKKFNKIKKKRNINLSPSDFFNT